jgi:hypothetical protein
MLFCTSNPAADIQDAFRGLAGSTLNFVRFGRAVERIDNWYRKRGILGQVKMMMISSDDA